MIRRFFPALQPVTVIPHGYVVSPDDVTRHPRDAALNLLLVTNELFFHVLDHLGHGVKLTDPLTCYRVHDSNMTNRSTPGTQQDYMHQVSTEVAARLREMAQSPPSWANAPSLRRLAWHFTDRASSHAREAPIQRGNSGRR